MTPLMLAAQGGHTESDRTLLTAGANPRAKRKGMTALKMAQIAGHDEVASMFASVDK